MLASRSAATAQEKVALLNCRRLPGRLNTSETALLLGFQEHDVAPLIAAKLLVPLGKPLRMRQSILRLLKCSRERRTVTGFRTQREFSAGIGFVRINEEN